MVDVKTAIPMIMGANIGTSMTSTLVSLTHIGDPEQVISSIIHKSSKNNLDLTTTFSVIKTEYVLFYSLNEHFQLQLFTIVSIGWV